MKSYQRKYPQLLKQPSLKLREAGNGFVEFILVAPVVLFITFSTLRLVQILQANDLALVLSREMASEAFKTCSDIFVQDFSGSCVSPICPDEDAISNGMQSCLKLIVDKYHDQAQTVLPPSSLTPNFSLNLFVAGQDNCPSNPSCTKIAVSKDSQQFGPCLESEPSGMPGEKINARAFCSRRTVVQAQVRFSIQTVASFLPGSGVYEVLDETIL